MTVRRRWNTEISRRLPVMEQQALQVHRLGARVLLELVLEIGCHNNCLPDVADRLASYSGLTLEMVRLAGADRMIPRRPVLVPA